MYKELILKIYCHTKIYNKKNQVKKGTSQATLMVKNPPANAGDARDTGLILVSGRSPGGRHSNPLQCSCLENPMDRGAWQATVHGFTK